VIDGDGHDGFQSEDLRSQPLTASADDLGQDEQRHVGRLSPENVSVKARAMVTAGLANEVEAVNQQAAAM
jgi:hypothetical protein